MHGALLLQWTYNTITLGQMYTHTSHTEVSTDLSWAAQSLILWQQWRRDGVGRGGLEGRESVRWSTVYGYLAEPQGRDDSSSVYNRPTRHVLCTLDCFMVICKQI